MPRQRTEVEFLRGGMDQRTVGKGAFVQNMLFDDGSWHVRKGFGQVAELDTTMCKPLTGGAEYGYTKHLGSHLMRTNFGHDQIVSVFLAKVNTGTEATLNTFVQLFIVRVYDLTTDDSWEEPIYRHTASIDERYTPLADQHGVYATNGFGRQELWKALTDDYQSWVAGVDEGFFFAEFNDVLYFGSENAGLLVYFPAQFYEDKTQQRMRLRSRQLESHWGRNESTGYEESSIIIRPRAQDGLFADAWTYLTTSEFPKARVAAVIKGRLALAEDRTIYFSDQGKATAIAAPNFIEVPSRNPITAMREINGNLLIWSEDETWFYQPSSGFLSSQGRLMPLSETIGCVGQNAIGAMDQAVVWVDKRGVYLNNGGLQIQKISDEIDPYFTDQVTNPLTSAYTDGGFSDFSTQQPRSVLSFDERNVHVAYNADLDALFVGVPEQNTILCWSERRFWSYWSVESLAHDDGAAADVGQYDFIQKPWVLSDNDEVYVVGGIQRESVADGIATWSGGGVTVNNYPIVTNSYYVLRYGRGGAIDRNVEDEDSRRGAGFFEIQNPSAITGPPYGVQHQVFIGEPIWMDAGFTLPGGKTLTSDHLLLPVYVQPNAEAAGLATVVAPEDITIRFRFDTDHYLVELGAGDVVDLVFPPEREASKSGWSSGTGESAVYADTTYAVTNPDGEALSFKFDGSGASGGWTHKPYMDLIPGRPNLLFYVPFKSLRDGTPISTNGLGIGVVSYYYARDVPPFSVNQAVWHVWRQYDIVVEKRLADSVAQSVTWCWFSEQIAVKGNVQSMLREVRAHLLSRGDGDDKLNENWLYGVFNVFLAADWRGWATQIRDLSNGTVDDDHSFAHEAVRKVGTVRDRAIDFSGNLEVPRFGQHGYRWGSSAAKATNDAIQGRVLAADHEVAEIVISEALKGGWFRIGLAGDMMNKGEALAIESASATLLMRPGGKARRWARSGRGNAGQATTGKNLKAEF